MSTVNEMKRPSPSTKPTITSSQWFVLAESAFALNDSRRRYLGQAWDSSGRRPLTVLVGLQQASLFHKKWVAHATQRAKEILGVNLVSVPIEVVGSGRDSQIVISGNRS